MLLRLDVYVTYIYHSGEGIHDIFFVQRCNGFGIVASDIVGDIGEQFGEISNFEYLVQCKELQRGDSCAFEDGWERTVGEGSSCFLLDDSELGRIRIRETIWQWEFEWGSSDTAGCDGEC